MGTEPDDENRDRNPSPSPLPLDYRVARDERRRLHPAIPLIGGAVVGVAIVGCAGAGCYISLNPLGPHLARRVAVIAWVAIALLSTLAGIWAIRRCRARGIGWFETGMLLGIGITALMEGICFSNQ